MKKTYISPAVKIGKVHLTPILAGSIPVDNNTEYDPNDYDLNSKKVWGSVWD